MASNQYLARLGFVLALDQSEFVQEVTEAQKKFKDFTAEVKRDSSQAAKAALELDYATKTYGKTLTKVEEIQEAFKSGKYAQAEQWQKDLLLQKAAAYDKVAQAAQKANQAQMKSGGLTPQQSAALGYQTTDIITGLAGGQNPLMVLLQQGGQLRDQFGGFKNLFAAIATVVTPLRATLVGVGAAVAGVAYAMYQGQKESTAFKNALTLTGGFAGVAENQFNSLAKTIESKYNVTIGDAREAMQMLVSSGRFTAASLEPVAKVIAKIASLSGETASAVAQNLMPSLDGTASSAAKLNEKYHFLSVEQYKYISQLEKQGKIQEAIQYTTEALSDKLDKQKERLGTLERGWIDLKKAGSAFMDWFKSIGRDADGAEELGRLAKKIEQFAGALSKMNEGDRGYEARKKALDDFVKKYEELAAKMNKESGVAAQISKEAEANEARIAFEKKYGQQLVDLRVQNEEYAIKARYETMMAGLDKIKQLELQKQMETELEKVSIQKRINSDPQIAGQIKQNAAAKAAYEKAKLAREAADLQRDEAKKYEDRAFAEQDLIDKEKERIRIYKEGIFSTKEELDIAQSRLRTAQEIAEIERNKILNPIDRAVAKERLEKIQQEREQLIKTQIDLDRMKQMSDAVFNNMLSAIDNFVRTGKLSFKSLAQSIIQDLIAIQLKAQATQLFNMGGSMLKDWLKPGVNMGTATGADMDLFYSGSSALGGNVSAGAPYLVGEEGPEMFVPRSAGTIVPTGQLASAMGGPQVVYNGPYIANMQAIDTQSATQFLARNKQAVYAANQSAARGLPTSR